MAIIKMFFRKKERKNFSLEASHAHDKNNISFLRSGSSREGAVWEFATRISKNGALKVILQRRIGRITALCRKGATPL